ncbi:unnamed protein product [Xylocopa violacea]|uniref:PiggyBac transposable element-derived protein domain-containing protein n=1 Tax=Xylocopa violacea TaxID=135666 RepID=A0ABP1P1F7_XYLVO
MSTTYEPSTSANEPQTKRTKYLEEAMTYSDMEEDILNDLLYSDDSYSETEYESDEDTEVETGPVQSENEHTSNTPEEKKWIDDYPPRPEIPFTGSSELNDKPHDVTPFAFFDMFFTTPFLEFLVNETNAYAAYIFPMLCANRKKYKKWKDTNIEEMKIFLGLLFLMGIIRVNRINDYWRKHPLFNLPFSNFMCRDRFLILLVCIHFDRERVSTDILHKIRPVLIHFNNSMSQLYNPSKELIVDESMILCHGRLQFMRYLLNKTHKYGVKLYVLAESDDLVQKLHVCTGSVSNEVDGSNHLEKIMSKLLEELEGKGHSIYMSNYYTSVSLVEDLLKKKIYCTGTLRVRRKGNPSAVTNAILKRGQSIHKYTEDGICCCKWKDKRDVLYISSEYGGKVIECRNKPGECLQKPELIIWYNKFMKRIDRLDQILNYYSIAHKSLRWYKKLGIHIMHIMLHNAYIFYNRYNNVKMNLHDFQVDIIMGLLSHSQKLNLVRKVKVHLPETLPKGKNDKTMRKRCKNCMNSTKKRKDTVFHCPQCPGSPGLCLTPCFKMFHNYH